MKKIYYGQANYNSKEINACLRVLKKQSLSLMTGQNVKSLEKKLRIYLEKNMHLWSILVLQLIY